MVSEVGMPLAQRSTFLPGAWRYSVLWRSGAQLGALTEPPGALLLASSGVCDSSSRCFPRVTEASKMVPFWKAEFRPQGISEG